MTTHHDRLLRLEVRARNAVSQLRDRLREQRGQALLEYALILTFVAVACVAALTFKLPAFLIGVFDQVSSKFP